MLTPAYATEIQRGPEPRGIHVVNNMGIKNLEFLKKSFIFDFFITIANTPKKGNNTAESKNPIKPFTHWECAVCPIYNGKVRLPDPKNIEKRANPIIKNDGGFIFILIIFILIKLNNYRLYYVECQWLDFLYNKKLLFNFFKCFIWFNRSCKYFNWFWLSRRFKIIFHFY